MAQSNTVSVSQQVIADHNTNINTRVGSPVYFLVVLPGSKLTDKVQSTIDLLNNNISLLTATDEAIQDALITNFGLTRLLGKEATGELKIVVSNTLPSYTFPTGSVFTNAAGDTLLSTADVTIITADTIEAIIPVQTQLPTEAIFEVGETFTSNVYGSLIESLVVSTQIDGGTTTETNSEMVSRISKELSETTLTPVGITTKLKTQFSSIIDIAVKTNEGLINRIPLNRPSGLRADIYVKSSLKEVSRTETVANSIVVIEEPIVDILTSDVFTNREITNPGTIFEVNTFTVPSTAATFDISYLTPTDLVGIQNFLDNPETFPIGVDLLAVQATPIIVSGEVFTTQEPGTALVSIKNHINNHLIGDFKMSNLINASGLIKYELPITLTFENQYTGEVTQVQNTFEGDGFSGYYAGDVKVTQV